MKRRSASTNLRACRTDKSPSDSGSARPSPTRSSRQEDWILENESSTMPEPGPVVPAIVCRYLRIRVVSCQRRCGACRTYGLSGRLSAYQCSPRAVSQVTIDDVTAVRTVATAGGNLSTWMCRTPRICTSSAYERRSLPARRVGAVIANHRHDAGTTGSAGRTLSAAAAAPSPRGMADRSSPTQRATRRSPIRPAHTR